MVESRDVTLGPTRYIHDLSFVVRYRLYVELRPPKCTACVRHSHHQAEAVSPWNNASIQLSMYTHRYSSTTAI